MPPCVDSSKHDAHIECCKKFTMSSHMAKRSLKGKEHQRWTTLRECKDQGKGAKQLFPKECRISIYIGAIKIKYKKLFPYLWTLQTSVDAIVDLLTSRKVGTCWKLFPMVNSKKESLWFMTNPTGDIPTYQRMKQ